MNLVKLLARVRTNKHNVRFSDFVALIKAFGFEYDHQNGSHIGFKHTCGASLNVQSAHGEAKSYQIDDLLEAVDKYQLRLK
ncbi:MAG: type II toxin-antitoxin system HicA family toxin [Elusimicrobiota bacterium]